MAKSKKAPSFVKELHDTAGRQAADCNSSYGEPLWERWTSLATKVGELATMFYPDDPIGSRDFLHSVLGVEVTSPEPASREQTATELPPAETPA